MALLEFKNVSKRFPGVVALDSVSWKAEGGSVHALCGENGAGKSTLLKILSGVYQPDEGCLVIDGKEGYFNSPPEAINAGIAVIYQELNLVPDLSVAENIYLGHFPASGGFVNKSELNDLARVSLKNVGLDVDPREKLGRLSLAQRQMVEIAKALSRNANIIAFDEPTSSLSSREVVQLFRLIEELRDAGKAVLYVSHRMDEVTTLCDACTVLRDGKHIETFTTMEGVDADKIVSCMIGRALEGGFGYESHRTDKVCLEVKEVMGPGLAEPVSLNVNAGEVLGIFGLVGAGRTEVLKAIYLEKQGQVTVNGNAVARKGPLSSIAAGIVFCPEDRKHEGIIPLLSVGENLNLSARRNKASAGFLNKAWEKQNATDMVAKLRVKTSSIANEIRNLSGGNQQKVILARWLSENVSVILLDEPTRGIDVGAKAEIYQIIRDLAKQGVAVILVSSELPEVMGVSDRILVMCEGKITGEMSHDEATEKGLLRMALPGGGVEASA